MRDIVRRNPAFFRLIPYTLVAPVDLAARGSRRQIALIYELPTDLIDSHLTNLPHHGRPCIQAPHSIAAEQKPTGYQNSRMVTRRRSINDKITVLHNNKLMPNKTKTITIKHISRRGQSSRGQRLSDTRRNNKSYSSEALLTTQ